MKHGGEISTLWSYSQRRVELSCDCCDKTTVLFVDGCFLILFFLKLVVVLFSKLGLERRNLAELRKVLPDFERTVSLCTVLT